MQPFNTLTAELVGGPRDGERIQCTDPSQRRLELTGLDLPQAANDDELVKAAVGDEDRVVYERETKWQHQGAGVYVARFRHKSE